MHLAYLRWVLSPFWNSYMYRVREKERRKLQQSAEWNSTYFLCYQSVTSWAILWWIILLYYDSTWICRTSDGVNCYKGIKSNHVFQIRQFCSFIHLNLLGDCKSHCLLCKSCLSSFIKTFSQHLTWGRDTSKNVQLGGFINWETMRAMFEFP